ncbi:MAG: LamG domain-containing protein [bacterium]|nr:LamG domain-containing protein [bacterium]
MGGSMDKTSKDNGSYPELLEIGTNLTLLPVSRDPNLVGYWKFNETSGTNAYDASGRGNNGTLTNGPTWTTGRAGNALNFDGVDDFVNAGNAASLQVGGSGKSFTLEGWTKRASSGVYHNIIWQGTATKNNGLHFEYRNTNVFTLDFYGNGLNTPIAYTDVNEWHHWVGTYDGSTNARKLYRDGILVANDTATEDYLGSGTLFIGQRVGGAYYFNGSIDEVRIYNRALSAAEISAIYNATK